MAIFKSKIKETTEDRLQKAINLGRELVLQEVLEWLEKNTHIITYYTDDTKDFKIDFKIHFRSKEQMLQSFKEQFNIE